MSKCDRQMSFWGTLGCPICVELYESLNALISHLIDLSEPVQHNNIVLFSAGIGKSSLMKRSRFKKAGKLDDSILSILIGTLLGDAHAEKRTNTRISFQQEDSNKDYLLSLWHTFMSAGLCSSTAPKPQRRSSNAPGLTRTTYRFKTYTYSDLNWLHSLFYKYDSITGKYIKVIPTNLGDYLTPLALAVWFMDDGKKQGSGYSFATNSFTKQEVEFLCHLLWVKFNILATPNITGYYLNEPSKAQYCVYVHATSVKQFNELVYSYIVPTMRYKLII